MDTESQQVFEALRLATQILAGEGVLDGFGHVSARNPRQGERYFMVRDNSSASKAAGDFVELDRESRPVLEDGPRPSMERFIHGEIYRARRDVRAIVHTHAPELLAFGVSATPLRPVSHMCGFLAQGAPVFDIAKESGETNMLVTTPASGQALARCLGKSALVLMRGHGATIVGTSLEEAVFRAIYATLNARVQPVAIALGNPKYLSLQEAALADDLHKSVLDRPWRFLAKKWSAFA